MTSVAASAQDIAGLYRQIAGLCGVGIGRDLERATGNLERLLHGPWQRYRAGLARSALTESGAPLELSVKWVTGGPVSVRFVADVADGRVGWTGNHPAYLQASRLVTEADPRALEELLRAHLWDAPSTLAPTMMHGVGVDSGGATRASLYLPAGWLDLPQLSRRLPDPCAPLPGPAAVVAYDFRDGALAAWKTYHWLVVDPDRRLRDHPSLSHRVPVAERIHDRLAGDVPPAGRAHAGFVQRTVRGTTISDSVYFFTRPWGMASLHGAAELLAQLARDAGLPLDVLRGIHAAAHARGLPLHVGLISVGGSAQPSVTLYFWPR